MVEWAFGDLWVDGGALLCYISHAKDTLKHFALLNLSAHTLKISLFNIGKALIDLLEQITLILLAGISAGIDMADADGDGTIDYDEFITATMHLNRMDKEEHLYAAFQFFDKDGSSYITRMSWSKLSKRRECTMHMRLRTSSLGGVKVGMLAGCGDIYDPFLCCSNLNVIVL